MKTIISGGRNYKFTKKDFEFLSVILNTEIITEIVSGGAPGADSDGEKWALSNGIPVKRFLADWKIHGRAAGPIRNRQMAQYAEALITFPGGRGSKNMIEQAIANGLKIFFAYGE